nr:hypothetical protein [Escherichia coli]
MKRLKNMVDLKYLIQTKAASLPVMHLLMY